MTKVSFPAVAVVMLCAIPAVAADVTGRWSGSFYGGPLYLMLKQDGGRLTGSGGPNENQQALALAGGKVEGDRLTFQVGPFQFDMRVNGDDMQGEMKNADETIALTLTRVEALERQPRQPADGPAPAFEVASVKPNKSGVGGLSGRGGSIRPTRGQISMENVSLWKCVAFAYGIEEEASA